MNIDFFDLIRFFASFQLTLVCVVILFNKSRRKHQKILGFFLFSQAAYIIIGIFSRFDNYFKNEDLRYIFYILYSFTYLIGPSLYIYIKYVIDKDFKIQLKHITHVLLFILFLVVNPLFLHIPGIELIFFNENINPDSYTLAAIALFHVQILGYLIFSVFIVEKYIHNNKVINSLTEAGKNRLNWVRFLLYSFLLLWLIESLIYFTYTYYYIFLCHIKIILAFLQFIVANLIVFQGLKKPQIFYDDPAKLKYYKNIIKEEDKETYLNKLLQFMKDETPYLDPQISLSDVASKLDISTNLLSQLLNTILKKSFYDFINSYRIEAAKKLLSSKSEQQKTVLEIIYEVGFSSKSVFNNAFKKHTGLTPTEFRKRNK